LSQLPNNAESGSLSGLARSVQEIINYLRAESESDRVLNEQNGAWTIPTNLTETRTYDANATSTAELADALGTLVSDLIDREII
jgi:hypothetical protein